MTNENDLMMKLMTAKKIMTKHNEIGRGGIPVNVNNSAPMVEDFKSPQATYNLPQEFLSEERAIPKQTNNELPTSERILNSRLPDEIKRLSEVEKQKRKQHQSRRRDIVEEYASTNEWGMNKMSR